MLKQAKGLVEVRELQRAEVQARLESTRAALRAAEEHRDQCVALLERLAFHSGDGANWQERARSRSGVMEQIREASGLVTGLQLQCEHVLETALRVEQQLDVAQQWLARERQQENLLESRREDAALTELFLALKGRARAQLELSA